MPVGKAFGGQQRESFTATMPDHIYWMRESTQWRHRAPIGRERRIVNFAKRTHFVDLRRQRETEAGSADYRESSGTRKPAEGCPDRVATAVASKITLNPTNSYMNSSRAVPLGRAWAGLIE